MGAADGKAITRALADNVLSTRFDDLSAATVANAKDRILDIVGCAIGGARAPGNAGLIELLKHWGGRPEATVLGHGLKAPAPTAAQAHPILCPPFGWGGAP